ncbi:MULTISPECIES: phage tail protein [unclassified Paraburkholderia]|uniref:phage tail protein n=1 Tax=unclassified Paraburkholderia TaxID=2615204 RepID=UPI002AB20C44|nr:MULTISPECIES: phage tail protein [unclassified Paraburkholderia]
MIKPASLRTAIVAALPDLATNPEKLTVYIDAGSIASTSARTPSFDYSYTLNIHVLDFAGDADLLFIAIVEWVRQFQNDLTSNTDERERGITFEIDILDNALSDVSIKLALTESVIVKQGADGKRNIAHVDDSQMPAGIYLTANAADAAKTAATP